MVQAFVGIGANLGDAQAAVRQALRDIAALPGTRLVQASSLWRSEPVDASGPDFINAVAEVETALDAHALLAQLQGWRRAPGASDRGRMRRARWIWTCCSMAMRASTPPRSRCPIRAGRSARLCCGRWPRLRRSG